MRKMKKYLILILSFALTLSMGMFITYVSAADSDYDDVIRVAANPQQDSVVIGSRNDLAGAYSVQINVLNAPAIGAGIDDATFMRIRLGDDSGPDYLGMNINGGNFSVYTVINGVSQNLTVYNADGVTPSSGNFLVAAVGWCLRVDYIFKFSVSADGSKLNIYYDRASTANPCTTLRNVVNIDNNTDFSITDGKVALTALTTMPSAYELVINEILFNGIAADLMLSPTNNDLTFSNVNHFSIAKKTQYSVSTAAAETKHERWVSDFSFTDEGLNDGDVMFDIKFSIRRTADNGIVNGAFGIILGLTTGEETMNTNGITGFLVGSSTSLMGVFRGNGANMDDNALSWANQQFLGQVPAGTPGKVKLVDNLASTRTVGGYYNANTIANGLISVQLIGKKGGELSVSLRYRTSATYSRNTYGFGL